MPTYNRGEVDGGVGAQEQLDHSNIVIGHCVQKGCIENAFIVLGAATSSNVTRLRRYFDNCIDVGAGVK